MEVVVGIVVAVVVGTVVVVGALPPPPPLLPVDKVVVVIVVVVVVVELVVVGIGIKVVVVIAANVVVGALPPPSLPVAKVVVVVIVVVVLVVMGGAGARDGSTVGVGDGVASGVGVTVGVGVLNSLTIENVAFTCFTILLILALTLYSACESVLAFWGIVLSQLMMFLPGDNCRLCAFNMVSQGKIPLCFAPVTLPLILAVGDSPSLSVMSKLYRIKSPGKNSLF